MDDLHQIVRTCQACEGAGQWYAPHCALCGQEVDSEGDWAGKTEGLLLCGHDVAANLKEWIDCEVCGGNGRIIQTFTPEQWQRRQRRRAIRWAFVSLLLFILIATLIFAIIREPGYLCGSSWYGLLVLFLAHTIG